MKFFIAVLGAMSSLLGQRIAVPPPDGPALNAPYTADGVNEMVQTLADGTRITRKNTVHLARDSRGRTRIETHFEQVGAWSTGKQGQDTVVISDPVSGQTWQLDPRAKTALALSKASSGGGRGLTESHAPFARSNDPGTKVENLGQKNISGFLCEGTRLIHVIPAGEEGNDRPITIVNERWYSPELRTVVLSTQSDPRMGNARYELSNINRTEPPAALFEIPPEYKRM